MVVDLPAPLGPRSANVSPRRDLEVEAVEGGVVAVAVTGTFEAQSGLPLPRRSGVFQGKRPEGHCRAFM